LWGYPMVLTQAFTYGIVKAFQALSTETVKDGFIETVEKADELRL
jgi:hypothetical protein